MTDSLTTDTAIGTRVVNGRLVGVANMIFEDLGFGVSAMNGTQNTRIQSNSISDNGLGTIDPSADTPEVSVAMLSGPQ